MRALLPCVLLAACTSEGGYLLDGEYVESLSVAASIAQEGAVLQLTGTVPAGVVFPHGVTLVGPATLVEPPGYDHPNASDGRLLVVDGDLVLRDIELVGGDGDEGASVHARALTMDRVDLRDANGASAVYARADVSILDSNLSHDRTLLEVRSPIGRPPTASFTDSFLEGFLLAPADRVDLKGVRGWPTLETGGRTVVIEDAELTSLNVRSQSTTLLDLTVERAAFVLGQNLSILEMQGGLLQVDVEDFAINGFDGDGIGGVTQVASLANVRGDFFSFLEEDGRVSADHVVADRASFWGSAVYVNDLVAETAQIIGPGSSAGITLDGRRPELYARGNALSAVVIRSSEQPMVIAVEGAAITGGVFVEPPGSTGESLLDTNSFGLFDHISVLAGTRTRIAPDFAGLQISNSLIQVVGVEPQLNYTVWGDTTIHAGNNGQRIFYGLDLTPDPIFIEDNEPYLPVGSPWVERGGFAGDHGVATRARWEALPLARLR